MPGCCPGWPRNFCAHPDKFKRPFNGGFDRFGQFTDREIRCVLTDVLWRPSSITASYYGILAAPQLQRIANYEDFTHRQWGPRTCAGRSIADSPLTQQLVIAPGNPGMAPYGEWLTLRPMTLMPFAITRRRCRLIWWLLGLKCHWFWDWLTS